MDFILYDAAGRIVAVGHTSRAEPTPSDGLQYRSGTADARTEYIDTASGDILPRPALAVAWDGSALSGVPDGAEVMISGPGVRNTFTADGSDIELLFAAPGRYRYQVRLWPYQDVEGWIDAG